MSNEQSLTDRVLTAPHQPDAVYLERIVTPLVALRTSIAGLALSLLLAPPAASIVRAQDAAPEPAAPTRVVPVRAAQRDPSLTAFLEQLKAIVRKRDAAALVPLVVEDILLDFGPGPQDRKHFAEHWKLKDPNSYFWHELEWLLTVDGDDTHPGMYCLPYAWWSLPPEREDRPDSPFIIVRDNAPLRTLPSTGSALVAMLSYDIVDVDRDFGTAFNDHSIDDGRNGEPHWVKVSLPDGRRGFVASDAVWNPIGLRIEFALIDGRWRITGFIAGD